MPISTVEEGYYDWYRRNTLVAIAFRLWLEDNGPSVMCDGVEIETMARITGKIWNQQPFDVREKYINLAIDIERCSSTDI